VDASKLEKETRGPRMLRFRPDCAERAAHSLLYPEVHAILMRTASCAGPAALNYNTQRLGGYMSQARRWAKSAGKATCKFAEERATSNSHVYAAACAARDPSPCHVLTLLGAPRSRHAARPALRNPLRSCGRPSRSRWRWNPSSAQDRSNLLPKAVRECLEAL